MGIAITMNDYILKRRVYSPMRTITGRKLRKSRRYAQRMAHWTRRPKVEFIHPPDWISFPTVPWSEVFGKQKAQIEKELTT